MTDKELLDFMHEYRKVRGFAPRRLCITLEEWLALIMAQRFLATSGFAMFDGAIVVRMRRPAVVAAIREWDLLP